MKKLRKRLSLEERIGSVVLIDLAKDPDYEEAKQYVIGKFSEKDWKDALREYEELGFKLNWLVIDNGEFIPYEDYDQILEDYKTFTMFNKKERSSFRYWFAHWCAFQMTALNLRVWKWKYLLHDIEKPFLKLIWKYEKVQQFHRKRNSHHLEYGFEKGWDKVDWLALVIDWECCQYSKQEAQLDARETLEYELKSYQWKKCEKQIRPKIEKILNVLDL